MELAILETLYAAPATVETHALEIGAASATASPSRHAQTTTLERRASTTSSFLKTRRIALVAMELLMDTHALTRIAAPNVTYVIRATAASHMTLACLATQAARQESLHALYATATTRRPALLATQSRRAPQLRPAHLTTLQTRALLGKPTPAPLATRLRPLPAYPATLLRNAQRLKPAALRTAHQPALLDRHILVLVETRRPLAGTAYLVDSRHAKNAKEHIHIQAAL